MSNPSPLESIISLAKRRGFVFQSGEIYGGSRSAWDYGPLGTALKENIKREWWKFMVQSRDDIVGIDSSIILPKRVWEASGHVDVFSDPLVECQKLPQALSRRSPARSLRREEGSCPRERDGRHRLRELRHPRSVDRAARVQRAAQDLPRTGRRRGGTALPAARDRAGHLRELRQRHVERAPQAAVRHRPGRQEFPQRDHPRQLHLPHARVRADGDGVLRAARQRRRVVHVLDRPVRGLVHSASGCRPTTSAATSTRARSSATTRSAPSTSSTASGSPAASGAS